MKYDIFNYIDNEDINLVHRLGVSVLEDGSLYFFGDKNNKSHVHEESIKKDVLPYISSNIFIDESWKGLQFYGNLSSQGLITICNSVSDMKSLYFAVIYSPDTLTSDQIKVMNSFRKEYLDNCPGIEVCVIDSDGNVIKYDNDHIGWPFGDYIDKCLKEEDVCIKK